MNLLIGNLAVQLLITDMRAAFVILWERRRGVLAHRNVQRKRVRLDSAPRIQYIAMISCVASHSRIALCRVVRPTVSGTFIPAATCLCTSFWTAFCTGCYADYRRQLNSTVAACMLTTATPLSAMSWFTWFIVRFDLATPLL